MIRYPPIRPRLYTDQLREEAGASPHFGVLAGASYPRKWTTRTLAASGALGESVAIPRMRVFPFAFTEGATSRWSFCFGPCTGPGIIWDTIFGTGTYVAPINKTVEIGTSLVNQPEAGVALTAPRFYNNLLELRLLNFALALAAGLGQPITTTDPQFGRMEMRLGLIVTDPQFFAVWSLWNNTGNSQQWLGQMRVLESIDSAHLAGYLGSA